MTAFGNPTFGIPSAVLPMVTNTPDPATGNAGPPIPASTWYQFFVRLSQLSAERPFQVLSVGLSPFKYTAFTIGHVFIGGSVDSIVLTRSGISLSCPSNIFIPVAANDVLTVAYTVLPAMTFLPSARA